MIVALIFVALTAGTSSPTMTAPAAPPTTAGYISTFQERCAVCHGSDGNGVPGIYPRLRGRVAHIASSIPGRDYVAQVILFGLTGPLKVDGVEINGVMPAFADLSDEQIAELVGYLSGELDPSHTAIDPPISAADVARLRAQKASPYHLHGVREGVVTPELESVETREAAPISGLEPEHRDYMRFCQGCHGENGCNGPAMIPPLLGAVGYFTRTPEGRAYLVRVPGVALSALDDERLARLMNWMLQTMSKPELLSDFRPYQTAEVSRLRKQALTEVTNTRAQLIEKLLTDRSVPRNALEGEGLSRCVSRRHTEVPSSGAQTEDHR